MIAKIHYIKSIFSILAFPMLAAWISFKPSGAFSVKFGMLLVTIVVVCSLISLAIKFVKYSRRKGNPTRFNNYLFIRPAVCVTVGLFAVIYLGAIEKAAKLELETIAIKLREECIINSRCILKPKYLVKYANQSQFYIYPNNVPYQIIYRSSDTEFTISLYYGLGMNYTLKGSITNEPQVVYGEL